MNEKGENVEQVEVNEIIAERVPPGDKWRLVDDSKNAIHPTLMDALEAYFTDTRFMGSFRLSPREGKLYAIKQQDKVIPQKVEKKFNIYGDPT